MVAPKLTTVEILEAISSPAFQQRGFGVVISGSSRDERSNMADTVLNEFGRAGHSWRLSLTPFELVAAYHFGQSDRLCRSGVLHIKDLGKLSQAEQDAIDVIQPIFSVIGTLETILDQRHGNAAATVVTTEYELPELAAQFSPRLASLVSGVGFPLHLDR